MFFPSSPPELKNQAFNEIDSLPSLRTSCSTLTSNLPPLGFGNRTFKKYHETELLEGKLSQFP